LAAFASLAAGKNGALKGGTQVVLVNPQWLRDFELQRLIALILASGDGFSPARSAFAAGA